MSLPLTVLTTNWHSSKYLNPNIDYISRRNGEVPNWIIVDSSQPPDDLDSRFTVIPGVLDGEWDPREHLDVFKGSIQHSLSLNKGLEYLKANPTNCRYLLVLDPDFYLTRPLKPILDEISSANLAFFGAEYSNISKPLYKKWPCAYCLFIDLEQVNLDDLDFRAGFKDKEERKEYSKIYADCGWRIHEKFSNSGLLASYDSHRHNDTIECLSDYYPNLGGFHLRAKIEKRDKRGQKHKTFIKKLLKGKLDER